MLGDWINILKFHKPSKQVLPGIYAQNTFGDMSAIKQLTEQFTMVWVQTLNLERTPSKSFRVKSHTHGEVREAELATSSAPPFGGTWDVVAL